MSEGTKEYVRFQRANYIVSDLKKSLKLYCDVLGFINQYESDAPDCTSFTNSEGKFK